MTRVSWLAASHRPTALNCACGIAFWLALLAGACLCPAQVAPEAPPSWKASAVIDIGVDAARLDLPDNKPDLIQQELLETNTVRTIAKFAGLTDADRATIVVAPWPDTGWVTLYQVGKTNKAFDVLEKQLKSYVQAREQGHTKAFLLAAMANRLDPGRYSDPGLKALASSHAMLPLSRLRKAESGSYTNKAGTAVSRSATTKVVKGKPQTNEVAHMPKKDEVCRWAAYTVTDGDIGWRYVVKLRKDGTMDEIQATKCDAKEYDPEYLEVIQEVEDEASEEMKKTGINGGLGSIHLFWQLKKEKLKARGIEWSSPSELNPTVEYN